MALGEAIDIKVSIIQFLNSVPEERVTVATTATAYCLAEGFVKKMAQHGLYFRLGKGKLVSCLEYN